MCLAATFSAPVEWGLGLVAALVIIVPMRLLGLWLVRKGASMERAKHGPMPGVTNDPRRLPRSDATPEAPEEPERYDPFDAG